MTMEGARNLACAGLQAAHRGVGHVPAAVPGEALALPEHGSGAALDRLRDVAATVAGSARPGEEGRAGRCSTAVGSQTFDRGLPQQRERIVNQVFSFASSSAPGSSSGSRGAS